MSARCPEQCTIGMPARPPARQSQSSQCICMFTLALTAGLIKPNVVAIHRQPRSNTVLALFKTAASRSCKRVDEKKSTSQRKNCRTVPGNARLMPDDVKKVTIACRGADLSDACRARPAAASPAALRLVHGAPSAFTLDVLPCRSRQRRRWPRRGARRRFQPRRRRRLRDRRRRGHLRAQLDERLEGKIVAQCTPRFAGSAGRAGDGGAVSRRRGADGAVGGGGAAERRALRGGGPQRRLGPAPERCKVRRRLRGADGAATTGRQLTGRNAAASCARAPDMIPHPHSTQRQQRRRTQQRMRSSSRGSPVACGV